MAELNTCIVFIMMAMRRNLPEALWNIPRYSTAFHSHTLRTHVILVVVKMSNTLRTHVILQMDTADPSEVHCIVYFRQYSCM